MFDVERVAFDQVEQTPGCADHHIHAAVETADLRSVGLTAVDGQHAHVEVLAVFGHRIGDLQGKFARGREDQCLHVCRCG
jgi:hypothetical protein